MNNDRRKEVYLVQHCHEFADGSESIKVIGIYSDRPAAEAAVYRSSLLDGFRDHPAGFSIDAYPLDEDQWTTGFFTDL